VHPQTWPEDLDYKGKKVLVIGSGATAATLVPAIAGEVRARHDAAALADLFHSPAATRTSSPTRCASSRSTRSGSTRSCAARSCSTRPCSRARSSEPEAVAQELLAGVRASSARLRRREALHARYRPWRSASPSCPTATCSRGRAGKASVVTDEIDRFTEKGILLKSGQELEADIIVTATGFNLSVLGDIAFTIDGKPLDFADTVTYRGMMFTGVPNMLGVRLLPRELDAARRPDRRLRLPAAAHMEAEGRDARSCGRAAPRGQGHEAPAWIDPRTSIPAT
jgi:cation diffusion facilitator CzcD-associated flavoprotein CzcO